MAIGGVAAYPSWVSQLAATTSAPAFNVRARSAAPGGSLMQDILATLEQMSSVPGRHTSSGSPRTQDLQNFMTSLMQALHQAAAGASSGTQNVSKLESAFQTLMQDLSTRPSTSAGTLMHSVTAAAGPANLTAGAAGTPTLQQFLQTLLQNLQNQGIAGESTGLLLNAVA